MIYDDKQLAKVFNYWQTKKYPQHLKQMIFEYVEMMMSQVPQFPQLQYKPDYEGQEGEYLKSNLWLFGDSTNYVWTFRTSFKMIETNYGRECEFTDKPEETYKINKNTRVCYLIRGSEYTAEKYHITIKKVYNVTKKQREEFFLYFYYKYFMNSRHAKSGQWKIYIPHPERNIDLKVAGDTVERANGIHLNDNYGFRSGMGLGFTYQV